MRIKSLPAAAPAGQTRQSGPDLTRCAGFLLVVLFHFYLFNYFYSVPQKGAAVFAADAFRTLSLACNGLFMTLTGYLYCQKPLRRGYFKGLGRVLLLYYVFAAASIPVRHFLLGDAQSLSEWAKRFFGFSGVYYGWYVEMYAGLMLLSPVLNAAAARLDEENRLGAAALLSAAATSLPLLSEKQLLPDWWTGFYPVTYYLFGAYIQKRQPKLHPIAALAGAPAVAAACGARTVLSTDGPLQEAAQFTFGSPPVMLIVLLLFLALYRQSVPAWAKKPLAFLADGTYGGYLISHLFDAWVYKSLLPLCAPKKYPLLFLLGGVPIYVVSCLIGALAQRGLRRQIGIYRSMR